MLKELRFAVGTLAFVNIQRVLLILCVDRKGYRSDATVSVLLGFLLFLIPARRPWPSSSKDKGKFQTRAAAGQYTAMVLVDKYKHFLPQFRPIRHSFGQCHFVHTK